MDEKQIKHFEYILMQYKESYEDLVNDMTSKSTGENNIFTSGELSNYDNHPADLGYKIF